MSLDPISYDLRQAVIQCCGKVFHYKGDLKDLLLRCGISEGVWRKYEQLEKFKIARSILSDLDAAGVNGSEIQHRIVNEFATMQKLTSKDLPDIEGAKSALLTLKQLAGKSVIVTQEERRKSAERQTKSNERIAAISNKNVRKEALRTRFNALFTAGDPQARGYSLEDLLQELFELSEVEYFPPYKTGPEQIDGMFKYQGHHYLIESRWRKSPPTKGDILEFQGKVRGKYSGTRGMFVSMVGFRQEVIDDLDKGENPVFLVDGRDLIEIMEDRVELIDALEQKILAASKNGNLYSTLY